jgi:hypothetical protein
MKNIFLILIFSFISLSTLSQINKDQNLSINTFTLDYSFLDYKYPNFDFSNINLSKDLKNTIFVYNKDLNKYDVYIYSNNTLNYTSSKNHFNFNTSQIINNDFRMHKVDSFNPYGATNFKEAVLLGVINTLF